MTVNKQDVATQYIYDHYSKQDLLRHDTITDKVQRYEANHVWRDLDRQDINTMVCDCAHETGVSVSAREIMTALQSHYVPDVHPLRDYLSSCPPYSPEMPDYIHFLAQQVHIKPAATDDAPTVVNWEKCFTKWFVAMVAGWMYDEVVNHHVLVLIGKQGKFKTTWLEHLMPPELRRYCSKMTNLHNIGKDDMLRVAEYGLINMDEIDSLNNRELNQLKSLVTTTDVNERAAYAYNKERRLRIASFCASGNRRDFLTDQTGNRRWLPFEVESIDDPYLAYIDYRGTYAQAVWMIEQGFEYWFNESDINVLEEHNAQFRDETSEEQLLPVYYGVPADDSEHAKFVSTAEVSDKLVREGSIRTPLALSRLGIVMAGMGFRSVRRGTPKRRGWLVYEFDNEEVRLNRLRMAKG